MQDLTPDPIRCTGFWTLWRRPAGRSMPGVIKTGRIEFYDRPTAWGLILGDDQELYVVRGRDGRGAMPRVGERVAFEPQTAGDGKRAAEVRLVSRGLAPMGREPAASGFRLLR
ncbi:MAG TPA: hypothetical protein VFT36_01130 [Methylomirabilota bacterium]|nr:hypothetical protein [Methylomirabilota bacterium]